MSPRYLVGIDLGTTNSVVAYIDTREGAGEGSDIHVFPVPQLAAQGEVRTLAALPSFLYFPTEDELSAGEVSATWNEDPPMVTGVLAREQGALAPGRQVSSAKSWLSCTGVDRRARILPAQAEPPQPTISPVEASARYLMHLRDAWNAGIGREAEARFEEQEIVLTVPASFDEEARELTVEAARSAGLHRLTLLEEPLAAFYAWIAAQPSARRCGVREGNSGELGDGEIILICDIGGGTTDFSLVRARVVNDELQFERTAIGEHLLLGGDNLDLALARRVEEKLKDSKLTLRQRYALRRACCAAKERLLGDSQLERVPVTVLGSGRAVVGQALSVDLRREEVLRILTGGFLPLTAPDEMPARGRPSGLRELGLPYAADASITKHLAAFLTQAAAAMTGPTARPRMMRPDAILFNGGFCAPEVTRERIVEVVSAWFNGDRADGDRAAGAGETGDIIRQHRWRPKVLANQAVESAVARGAAYYGRVRQGAGLRVRAGSARTYYVGLRSENEDGLRGICILPAGTEEGATLPLSNREFAVLANRPVSFTLYSSRTRQDAHGEVALLEEAAVHRHAPLVTLLRYGKKMRAVNLRVGLVASLTEVGTLELWCESRGTPHRWRLQFELRGEEEPAQQGEEAQAQQQAPSEAARRRAVAGSRPAAVSSGAAVEAAVALIRRVFGGATDGDALSPENLVRQMEVALGRKRESWTITEVRQLGSVLLENSAGRKKSPRHEVRWLNLSGFCWRPGFGLLEDDVQVQRLWSNVANGPIFGNDAQCQSEALVLLRRVAGGIHAGQQHELYRMHASWLGQRAQSGNRKRLLVNRQLAYEAWRLLGGLEHLPASYRVSLGQELLARIIGEPGDAIWLWTLGRLGARIPLYGPLHSVVAPEVAGAWLKALLELSTITATTVSAAVMIARRTDDRSRDIEDTIRAQAISRLMALGTVEEDVQRLSRCVAPDSADVVRSFGESLPPGLQLVSSSNCLLSVPALNRAGSELSEPA